MQQLLVASRKGLFILAPGRHGWERSSVFGSTILPWHIYLLVATSEHLRRRRDRMSPPATFTISTWRIAFLNHFRKAIIESLSTKRCGTCKPTSPAIHIAAR